MNKVTYLFLEKGSEREKPQFFRIALTLTSAWAMLCPLQTGYCSIICSCVTSHHQSLLLKHTGTPLRLF